MVKFDLQISCKLENVKDLMLPEDEEWWFTTRCSNCQEPSNTKIYLTPMDVFEVVEQGTKENANYVAKCKFCSVVQSIEYCQNSLLPYSDENQNFQTIATFNCRRVELVEFFPVDGFGCVGKETGTTFGIPY